MGNSMLTNEEGAGNSHHCIVLSMNYLSIHTENDIRKWVLVYH